MNASADEVHAGFLDALDVSADAVWLVARWLSGRGHNVRVNASGRAPSHDKWREYADSGDLEISQRLEVKGLGYDFTCRADWPFPDMLVCAKHSWDRACPKPYAFIHLNRARTHAAIMLGASSGTWRVVERQDRRRGMSQTCYAIDPDAAKFAALGST